MELTPARTRCISTALAWWEPNDFINVIDATMASYLVAEGSSSAIVCNQTGESSQDARNNQKVVALVSFLFFSLSSELSCSAAHCMMCKLISLLYTSSIVCVLDDAPSPQPSSHSNVCTWWFTDISQCSVLCVCCLFHFVAALLRNKLYYVVGAVSPESNSVPLPVR